MDPYLSVLTPGLVWREPTMQGAWARLVDPSSQDDSPGKHQEPHPSNMSCAILPITIPLWLKLLKSFFSVTKRHKFSVVKHGRFKSGTTSCWAPFDHVGDHDWTIWIYGLSELRNLQPQMTASWNGRSVMLRINIHHITTRNNRRPTGLRNSNANIQYDSRRLTVLWLAELVSTSMSQPTIRRKTAWKKGLCTVSNKSVRFQSLQQMSHVRGVLDRFKLGNVV